jgi:hypothetical protein
VRLTSLRTLGLPLAGLVASMVLAGAFVVSASHGDDHSDRDHFRPGNLVVSRSVYAGLPTTVTLGQTLPPGCVPGTISLPVLGGGTTKVTIPSGSGGCVQAIADGTYPTVFNNNGHDGSFGVTSPVFLDQMTTDGDFVNVLAIDPTQIVTSFSSKSELALNLADDRKSITFVGYRGGAGFLTSPNQLDVSNSNTPGVVDPSNPVVSQYYRAVAEVDDDGQVQITEGNAYSGNNGRAAIKANSLYYLTGNDNNGGLSKTQLTTTQVGVNLITSTGVELLFPHQTPPVPPNIDKIGDFEVTSLGFPSDKAGKDNNFRGLTIFHHTLYVTKGSGGNGINTVYQVGDSGMLPTLANAPGGQLSSVPITVLPGLWSGLAGNTTPPLPRFPFGIWFADAKTLYVGDEGDGTTANAATDTQSGLEKWVFNGNSWQLVYTLQQGLNLGSPYVVPTPPGATPYATPATDGLRNLTGRRNEDGTVTIWAVTSTVSASGDQGADPNKLVMITDRLAATTLPGDEHFKTLRTARYGEVLRGVSFTPGTPGTEHFCGDGNGQDHDGDRPGHDGGCDEDRDRR